MRIVFCIPSLGKGGAERVVSNLANYLSGEENSVLIVVNNKKNIGYKLNKNVQIFELDNKKRTNALVRNIIRLRKTKDVITEYKADVVISFLPMPSFRVLLLKNKLNCKIIVSDRNDPNKEYSKFPNNFLMRWLYPKADGFIFQTGEQKSFFNKSIQIKSTIIGNPLKEEFLSDAKVSKKEKIILNVGRLVEQKNQRLLIKAFSKLADKHSKYKLKIYGDGPLKKELLDYVIELNLTDRIEICGVVDNIREKLNEAQIFVLSSNYEGLPNALLEAMACGLPCISTDCPCGGPKELINNNENGILVKVGDEESLIESIDYLLSNEHAMKQIAKNALIIRENFNPKIINKKWEEYIKSVIKND